MKCKNISLSLNFGLFLVLFGVCSVSLDAHSYPASKINSTTYQNTQSQTIKLTRSARENPKSESYSNSAGPLAPGSHNLSIGVGQIFLLGRLGNNSDPVRPGYDNALGFQATYTYGVSELFGFESSLGYSSHSSGNLSLGFLSAGVRTNIIYFDRLVPFFNLGLGFYRDSETFTSSGTPLDLSKTSFGLQLGGGIDLLVTDKIFFGSRLTYHNIFTSSVKASNGSTYEMGGAFVSFLVHVGFNF